jgi:menin
MKCTFILCLAYLPVGICCAISGQFFKWAVNASNMAGFVDMDQRLFPLQDVASVVEIFKQQLTRVREPDLALLSIIAGSVENSLTCNRSFTVQKETDYDDGKLPAVEYHIVEALHLKFQSLIKGAVDTTLYGDGKYATRELVKRVSDVIWNSLTRSYYKDRAHLQSLFSYLTGKFPIPGL